MEFRLASGNAGTGRASEAHLNMDVNMRRLPDGLLNYSKFLVPLAGIMWHPYSTDGGAILSQSNGKTVYKQAKQNFRTAGILVCTK